MLTAAGFGRVHLVALRRNGAAGSGLFELLLTRWKLGKFPSSPLFKKGTVGEYRLGVLCKRSKRMERRRPNGGSYAQNTFASRCRSCWHGGRSRCGNICQRTKHAPGYADGNTPQGHDRDGGKGSSRVSR